MFHKKQACSSNWMNNELAEIVKEFEREPISPTKKTSSVRGMLKKYISFVFHKTQDVITHKINFVTSCASLHEAKLELRKNLVEPEF